MQLQWSAIKAGVLDHRNTRLWKDTRRETQSIESLQHENTRLRHHNIDTSQGLSLYTFGKDTPHSTRAETTGQSWMR